MKTRLIGLGNTILKDDGVGIYAVREIAAQLTESDGVEVVETEVAGFALMELMAGADKVVLIDSIQFDGVEPGTVVRIDPADLRTSLRLRSVHEIDLPTALELGRRLGLDMPEVVVVFGVQAEDALSFGETLTASVTRGLSEVAALALQEIHLGYACPACPR